MQIISEQGEKRPSLDGLTVEVNTLRADTLIFRIVLIYDMAAPLTLVPIPIGNSGHDFEMKTFDAVRAPNDGLWFCHRGREGQT